jgi:ZIP family zinc transporter
MTEAFLWGLVGSASLILGAMVVAVRMPGSRSLGLVMGFGSGVLISAVAYELVEEAATTAGGTGATAMGFFIGMAVFLLGDQAISTMGYRDRKKMNAVHSASGLAIVLGTVLDGVPESAVLGLTVLETGTVGAAVLAAVLLSNLPESIAATSSLRASGWSWARVYGLWTGIVVVSGAAAGLGYQLMSGASPSAYAFVLAFAGGAILAMLSTTMMPEAYEYGGRLVGLTTTVGFAAAYAITWVSS